VVHASHVSIEELLDQAYPHGASSGEVALRRPWRRGLARLAVRSRGSGIHGALPAALSRGAKRALDLSVAGALLVFLAPILVLVALAIRLDSPGPVFFRCRRVGEGGRDFDMLKFRKMVHGAQGPPLRSSDDERYTRLGSFLAGTRLDEIPQLWNVALGQMSLVGPRPEDPAFVERDPSRFAEVLKVRPGITGLSQLAFAREAEILDPTDRMGHYLRRILPQKLALDALYVTRRTLWMDVKILMWTAVAFFLDVAVQRGTGALGVRRRPSPEKGADARLRLARAPQNGSADGLAGVDVVILAGGPSRRETRTVSLLPEPLMPLGDRSVLETIVAQFDDLGVRRVSVCLGESADLVRSVFQYGGSKADPTFFDDGRPIGTAGPLRLVSGLDDTFLVVNGDVLTTLDYRELVRHHRASGNVLTVAAHDRRTRFDYGLLQVDEEGRLHGYREKPEIVSPVSMGVYAMEPRALAFIPRKGPFDVPDLADALIRAGLHVGVFRHHGLWFDVGRPREYQEALTAWGAGVA
jgi:lipopolysaccharide/colanic/teichoic acid biosynthesis glycosyltransferase/dTDP-glucose pyrophosphorylase